MARLTKEYKMQQLEKYINDFAVVGTSVVDAVELVWKALKAEFKRPDTFITKKGVTEMVEAKIAEQEAAKQEEEQQTADYIEYKEAEQKLEFLKKYGIEIVDPVAFLNSKNVQKKISALISWRDETVSAERSKRHQCVIEINGERIDCNSYSEAMRKITSMSSGVTFADSASKEQNQHCKVDLLKNIPARRGKWLKKGMEIISAIINGEKQIIYVIAA